MARPDSAQLTGGGDISMAVLANDNDPDGDRVELAGLSLPGRGTLSLTPERRVVYTPAAGFVGADSFTYTIADAHGAKAEGVVRVDVERRNAPPVATPDSIATSGEAVTLDLLANDNDPDGDPLRLTALTLPVKGRIAVNPSGTVTYTPPQGFTGSDSFTYRVSDGTAEAETEVTVAVTAPEVPTYANGYRYRRRLVVPPQTDRAEVAANFVLLIREQGNWLRPAASGGRVQSELGHDLRFELEDGTKLDHELERYQPATGSLLAWVRIPSFGLSDQLRLFLYYGKPGLAASEANAAGVWRGYLAVYDARTGADRSGQGRALTPSNVAAGELIGEAGAYDGSAVASRADAGFLAGHAALTVQAVTTPDASMLSSNHGLLAQGPMDGTDAGAGLTLQYLQQSGSGTPNVIHFKLACSDGNAFVLSGANAQRAEPQLLHGVWRQGQTPALFLDGTRVEPSGESAARSSVTAMPVGGLYLGAGARDPATGGWKGLIDEIRIAATAFSAARIGSEASNLSVPQTLYGLGDEDQAGQSDQAPVAVPIRAATTAGASVDVDAAVAAYDPDGPGLPQIVAVGAPAHGVATVVGGRLRYTPIAGYVGADRVAYTLASGVKQSSSTVSVAVSAAAEPARPKYPAAPARMLRVPEDYGTVQEAYAAAAAGDHISLANGTYGGTMTFGRAIAAGNPVVVKSRSGLGASFGGRVVVTGTGLWFHQVTFSHDVASQGNEDNSATKVSGAGVRFTRCLWSGKHALWLDRTVHDIHVGWCSFTGKARDVRTVSHIKLDMPTAGNWQSINQGPHHIYIYRNFFFDNDDQTTPDGDRTQYLYFGDTKVGAGAFGHIPECYVEYNLIYSDGTGRGR
ncbi:MAG TPA: DUF2341 domain-containing protein, partial [Geminicoccaceae bacterium]|nr:DUF2341 domain-containing protein [Geminicoccaceae bacterium]